MVSFCLAANGKTTEVLAHQVTFSIANHSARGTKRSPVHLSFLPQALVNESSIYFEWTTDIPSVLIFITDVNGTVLFQESYVSVAGETSVVSIANLASGNYTLHISIGNQTFVGSFSL